MRRNENENELRWCVCGEWDSRDVSGVYLVSEACVRVCVCVPWFRNKGAGRERQSSN